MDNNNLRIGHGIDIHAFEKGDHLVLGGVTIPFHVGMRAHSDGDVIIHALVDALLGASALGDIGQHFSETESCWQNCDSRIFLRSTVQLLKKQCFCIKNVDITLLAEAPRLNGYRENIRSNLAHDMEIAISQINIKATTTEKLGFIGRNEGIAATAIALICKETSR
jgi:2-C-methyl-D-erythritol 2,4-cyclodiphosphate synthase